MRIRQMRSEDLPGIVSVYDSRAAVSTGMLRRTPKRWRLMRRQFGSRGIWIVAEDRRRIVGYAVGYCERSWGDTGEVMWLPECDGTPLGSKMLNEMIRRLKRKKKPVVFAVWGMEGSPVFSLDIPSEFKPYEATGVFMAKVVDTRYLLRDAKRIVESSIRGRMRLRANGQEVLIGKGGGATIEVSMDAKVLLGLLLGTRSLAGELKGGRVEYLPKKRESLMLLQAAFPEQSFRIEDGW